MTLPIIFYFSYGIAAKIMLENYFSLFKTNNYWDMSSNF